MKTSLVKALAQAVLSLSPEERQQFERILAQRPTYEAEVVRVAPYRSGKWIICRNVEGSKRDTR